jgi:hypothetical protein
MRLRSGIDILKGSFRFRVKPMVFIKMLAVTFMLPFYDFGVCAKLLILLVELVRIGLATS